jgi:hypothetical protein
MNRIFGDNVWKQNLEAALSIQTDDAIDVSQKDETDCSLNMQTVTL